MTWAWLLNRAPVQKHKWCSEHITNFERTPMPPAMSTNTLQCCAAWPSQQLLWAPKIKHICKRRSGGNTLKSPNTQLRMLQQGDGVQGITEWKVREHCWDCACPTRCAQGSWRGHSHNPTYCRCTGPQRRQWPLSKPSRWTWASAGICVAIELFVSPWVVQRDPWCSGKAGTGLSIKVSITKQWSTHKGNLHAFLICPHGIQMSFCNYL